MPAAKSEPVIITRRFAAPRALVWPSAMYSEATFEALGDETELRLMWEAGEATAEEIAVFNSMHASMTGGCEGTFSRLDDYLNTL